MPHDVAALMQLAALDQRLLASVFTDRLDQRPRSVENVKPRGRKIDATLGQIAQQGRDDNRVLARPLPQAQ